MCVGQARRVRFRSKGRGLDSVEGKTNTSGLRFHLQAGADGNQGWLSWHDEQFPALIDWRDEVVHHALKSRIKYVRRLQRKLERQRRANNPEHYDAQGRIRKRAKGQGRRHWRESRGYQKTRRRLATTERKLAAHRRSLHGKLAHEIMRLGNDLRIEQVSYKGWQRRFGKSVGLRAPGRFVDAVKCVVARTRTAHLHEISTFRTRLSQYCHRCGTYTRKPLAQRFHRCPHCGLGSDRLIQRDLYSAWLASALEPL